MLGTNDLQIKYNKDASDIIKDLLWYEDIIKEQFNDLDDRKKYFNDCKMPKIFYIISANFNESLIFNEKSYLERKKVIEYFKKTLKKD